MKKLKLSRRNKIYLTFITVNITVLLLITAYYGSRLIHYYRLDNPKIKEKETLSNLVSLEKNLVIVGSGLYQKDNIFYYKGKDVNNYVLYSGRLWQIVSVDEDDTVKLITADSQTSLVWGIDNNYEDSYVRDWLNSDDEDHTGIFYDSLYNPDLYLEEGTWCIDIVDDNPGICEKTIEDKIGLLSISEYNRALGSSSFLNINNYFWMINGAPDDKVWYAYPEGKLNNESYTDDTYFSYGVRPVINLKKDVIVYGGNGNKNNPYIIEPATNNVISQKKVGEYVKYSGYNWRIAEITDNYVRLYMDEFIKEDGEVMDSRFSIINNVFSVNISMGKYLNGDFYNTLTNNNYLVASNWYTGKYDYSSDYDYKNVYNESTYGKIGMLQVGSLFIDDLKDYFLMNRKNDYEDTIYIVQEDGTMFADFIETYSHVRPAINIKTDIVILSGAGKKDNPYIIE